MSSQAITAWLAPLLLVLDPAHSIDWSQLDHLANALEATLAAFPVAADLAAGSERSRRLLAIRRALAEDHRLDVGGQSALLRLFAQFVCGYHDIDLRDAIGLGHGDLIARHATPPTQQRWLPRLLAGELAGIAITEPHGGSRPAETRTRAINGPHDTWLLTGRKTWIRRLHEAAVFIIFFRTPDDRLAAAAVDATSPGLHRQPIPPAGLAGWSWGVLDLDRVPILNEDVLIGDGMQLLRDHFTRYRPLVVATALGGAAAVFDTVTSSLAHRQTADHLDRLRDSALVTIGRAHAQLTTAILGTATITLLADTAAENAEYSAAAMKAHAIDTAYQAAADLALLVGAAGFRADSQIAKTRRDLNGLLYADGIHDSLYRTAGKHHTRTQPSVPQPRNDVEAQAIRRPCSHNTVTPSSAATNAASIRSASSGFTLTRNSSNE